MVEVRRAGPDDAGRMHELAATTFPLACPPGTPAEEIAEHIRRNLSEERFAEFLADPAREIFVADDFAGYTMLVYGEPTDPDVASVVTARPTVELSKCYARPEAHGLGIAAALVEASVASALARGMASMWLGVNQFNPRANRFYEKSGFAIAGEKTFHVGDDPQQDFTRVRLLR
jgi:GNAT superfamily N-acetyltransferase